MSEPRKPTTRREFIATGAIAAAAFMIVPRRVLGRGQTPPSDLVNIAVVGVNGMGASNAQAVMSQNIVAICDVDDNLVDNRLEAWRNSLKPPPPRQPRPANTTPRPPRTPEPTLDFENWGPSKLQQAADTKWRPMRAQDGVKRFIH